MNKLYIVDALGYIFRAYHALPPMTNNEGQLTQALYGFILQLKKILTTLKPQNIVLVFDGPKHIESRKEIFPEYKANRVKTEDDLKKQMKWASDVCEMLGISTLIVPEVEADDTIASIAQWAAKKEMQVFICSHDKDLFQLVSNEIHVINTHKDNLLITPTKVKEIFGVQPKQIIDYLSLVGDSSDNIPGLPGVGPKTAAKWLEEYKTLDEILKNKDSVHKGKKRELLEEHEKQLRINQKLIALNTQVPFPTKASFFEKKVEDVEKLKQFYKKMRFTSLLKDLPASSSKADTVPHSIVYTQKQLDELIQHLASEKELCIDLETDSLDTIDAKIVGIGIGTNQKVFYIPFQGSLTSDVIISSLKHTLESKPLFGHNIKFDLKVLQSHGIYIKHISFDTMLASYLLFAHSHRHSLDHLVLEFFDIQKTPITDLIGKGKKQISLDQVEVDKVALYCAEDVFYTIKLKEVLEDLLKKRELTSLMHTLEIPLIFVLAKMEHHGIYLDTKPLHILNQEILEKLRILESRIFNLAEEKFNINSTKQLAEILYTKLKIPPLKKTKTSFSTSVDVLLELAEKHSIAQEVIEYRKFEKLRSTYVEALPHFIHKTTKRIHPTFTQTVAATGRLSCQNPNLQNIPIRTKEGLLLREAFKPQKEDWSFLSADYSQIELRVVAHLSQDPTLISAFKQKEDIHTFTAHLIYNLPQKEITQKMRSFAKTINFGIIYGQSPYGLAKILKINPKEAKEFIDAYFDRYPKVKEFLETCIQGAQKEEKVRTLIGRERLIPEINSSNAMVRQGAERLAINTPIQGTAADIMKIAMLKIQEKIDKKKFQGFLTLQIHDELVFEVPDKEVITFTPLVKKCMEEAYLLSIPLTVNISVGKNWKEC